MINKKLRSYLTSLVRKYIWSSFEDKIISEEDFTKRFKIRYRNKWIVRQFENEYNVHWIWKLFKVPKDFGEKSQDAKRNNPNGLLQLSHGSEQFIYPAIRLILTGWFILLIERRSFSFNVLTK